MDITIAIIVLTVASIVLIWALRRVLAPVASAQPLPGTKWVIPTIGIVTIHEIYADTWGNTNSGAATIAYLLPDHSKICRIDRHQFMRTASLYTPEKKKDPRDDPEYREWLKIKLEIEGKA